MSSRVKNEFETSRESHFDLMQKLNGFEFDDTKSILNEKSNLVEQFEKQESDINEYSYHFLT